MRQTVREGSVISGEPVPLIVLVLGELRRGGEYRVPADADARIQLLGAAHTVSDVALAEVENTEDYEPDDEGGVDGEERNQSWRGLLAASSRVGVTCGCGQKVTC